MIRSLIDTEKRSTYPPQKNSSISIATAPPARYDSTTSLARNHDADRFSERQRPRRNAALALYPQIAKSWTTHWTNLSTLFEYPPDIRKAIYTTNAVESLNSVIRAATKRRKVLPNDDSARKVIYLAIEQAAKKWTMPIQNWRMALNRFVMEFSDRLPDYQ